MSHLQMGSFVSSTHSQHSNKDSPQSHGPPACRTPPQSVAKGSIGAKDQDQTWLEQQVTEFGTCFCMAFWPAWRYRRGLGVN